MTTTRQISSGRFTTKRRAESVKRTHSPERHAGHGFDPSSEVVCRVREEVCLICNQFITSKVYANVSEGIEMVPEGIRRVPEWTEWYPRGAKWYARESKWYPRGAKWYPKGSRLNPRQLKCYPKRSKWYWKGSKWYSRRSNQYPRASKWYPRKWYRGIKMVPRRIKMEL